MPDRVAVVAEELEEGVVEWVWGGEEGEAVVGDDEL